MSDRFIETDASGFRFLEPSRERAESILLEEGFTGTVKDSLGRDRHYVNGKQVAAPHDVGKGGDKGKGDDRAHVRTPAETDPAKAAADHAKALEAQVEKAPKSLVSRVSDWVANKYGSLREKYGPTGAAVVLGATVLMVPIPLPGTVMIPVAIAEAVKRIRGKSKKESEGDTPDVETILQAAGNLVRELYAAEGEDAPELDESKVRALFGKAESRLEAKDAAGHEHAADGKFGTGGGGGEKHTKARKALDAMGLAHEHLSDEQAAKLHDQIQALHAKAGGKPAVEKPTASPKVAAAVDAVNAAIAKDGDDPGPHSVERATKLLADLRASHTDEELVAIAKEVTGRGGRNAKQALAFLQADLIAVSKAIDSQKV